jgi:hypothetical protein
MMLSPRRRAVLAGSTSSVVTVPWEGVGETEMRRNGGEYAWRARGTTATTGRSRVDVFGRNIESG